MAIGKKLCANIIFYCTICVYLSFCLHCDRAATERQQALRFRLHACSSLFSLRLTEHLLVEADRVFPLKLTNN